MFQWSPDWMLLPSAVKWHFRILLKWFQFEGCLYMIMAYQGFVLSISHTHARTQPSKLYHPRIQKQTALYMQRRWSCVMTIWHKLSALDIDCRTAVCIEHNFLQWLQQCYWFHNVTSSLVSVKDVSHTKCLRRWTLIDAVAPLMTRFSVLIYFTPILE